MFPQFETQQITTVRTPNILFLCKCYPRHAFAIFCPYRHSHLEPLCRHTYIHKFSQVYIHYVIDTFVCKPKSSCANWHMFVTWRVLTPRTSLNTYTYSQIYIYYIIDTSVHEPVQCKLTYVCVLASAHSKNLMSKKNLTDRTLGSKCGGLVGF
jgi:hypothetical protein